MTLAGHLHVKLFKKKAPVQYLCFKEVHCLPV